MSVRRRVVPPLLRDNRSFRWFWLAQSVSLLGDQVSLLALPLTAVLVLHAGAAEMGYLTAANLIPNLLFSVHAGAWADRRGGRRRLMIGTDLGRAALLASIPIAYALDVLTIEQMYVVAFGTGTLSVLFWVSYNSLFANLLERDAYVAGSSLLNGSRAVSYVAGPSVAGLMVQVLSAPAAIAADVLSFLGSALCMRRIDTPEPPGDPQEHGAVSAGLRFLRDNAVLRSGLAATATINLFNFMFFALFILFATRELHVSPGTLGLVLGAGAVGSVIGSVVTAPAQRRLGVGPAYMLGCVLFPAPLVLVPLARGPHWLVLAMLFLSEFGSGIGVMLLDICGGAIMAALIPDRLRSRVAGAYMVVNYGVRPLGALGGGFLGAALGLRPALWVATVGAIAGVLWVLPSPIPRMRELPEPAG